MASQRLTFLYPQLFKPAQLNEARLCMRAQPNRRKRLVPSVAFSTATRAYQEEVSQRYGTAQDPALPPPSLPSKPSKPTGEKSLAAAIATEVKATPESGEKKAEKPSKEKTKPKADASPQKKDGGKPLSSEKKESRITAPEPQADKSKTKEAEPGVAQQVEKRLLADRDATAKEQKVTTPRPLETVSKIAAPTAEKPEEYKAPHMQAPPYVHHFDTYTLVRDLEKGGFTQDQSVTLMKAVRTLLAMNLDVAKDGLVGKSDRENVSFIKSPLALPLSLLLFPSHSTPSFNSENKI